MFGYSECHVDGEREWRPRQSIDMHVIALLKSKLIQRGKEDMQMHSRRSHRNGSSHDRS